MSSPGGPVARPLQVLLADDAVLVREGIARILEDAGFEVVGQVGDAETLLGLVQRLQPDVVIVDVRMPPTFTLEGLRATTEVRARWPEVGVLVLSQHIETRNAMELLGTGGRGVGYLLKDRVTSIQTFTEAVRRISAGGTAIDEEVVAALMRRSKRDGGLDALTPRETEVLGLMAEGLSNPAITQRLHLSTRTVESHIGRIFGKLGLLPDMNDDRRVLATIEYLRGSN